MESHARSSHPTDARHVRRDIPPEVPLSDILEVLGLSGSLRRASLNSGLLRAARALVPEGITITIHDWRDVPLYDGDVQERDGFPPPVHELREAIRRADGVLIATPEYNNATPGGLKNALDWVSRGKDQPLAGKPVALMGASPGGFGTVRAQIQVRQLFRVLGARELPSPELHVSNATPLFSPDGELTDDATRAKVAALVTALAAWIRRERRANG